MRRRGGARLYLCTLTGRTRMGTAQVLGHGVGSLRRPRGQPLRLRDGRYECSLCGAVLDVPAATEPDIVLKTASGRPTLRAITVAGAEIHACAISTRRKVQRESERATVLIAQGMVAEEADCSLSDALVLLQASADDEHCNLGEVALDVVERRISFR